MPELTKKQIELFLDKHMKDFTPITLIISKEEKEQAQKECDEYITNKNKNVYDMNPLSVYFIISKLSEAEQITFIRENINYLKENDNDVFFIHYGSTKISFLFSFVKSIERDKKIR